MWDNFSSVLSQLGTEPFCGIMDFMLNCTTGYGKIKNVDCFTVSYSITN